MKTLKKILTCEIKDDDKLDEREKAREKVLKAQRDMMNEKMADVERRRVNMDDINSMLKARLQKDIEISEYELEKSKKNNIFEDPMIKAIRQKQVFFGNLNKIITLKIRRMKKLHWKEFGESGRKEDVETAKNKKNWTLKRLKKKLKGILLSAEPKLVPSAKNYYKVKLTLERGRSKSINFTK